MSPRVAPAPLLAYKLAAAYRNFGVNGEKLLLAVSGGADSTALLVATAQIAPALRLTLAVASLDHGLRAESTAEVERVRALSADLGVAFHSRKLALKPGPRLEARARDARYEALEEIRTQTGCGWIATAHTASDQAETLLMRLLRGASLHGASGIRSRLGYSLRPLLDCTRAEVEHFLASVGVGFALDPMNRDFRFTRARIRAQLIPAVESVAGPEAIRHLAAFAAAAASDAALLDDLGAAAHDRLVVGAGRLDAAGFRALAEPLRRRVLARMLQASGARVDRAALSRAMKAVFSSGRATLSRGFELRSAGGLIRFVRSSDGKRSDGALRFERGWVEDSVSGLRIGLSEELPPANRVVGWLAIDSAALPLCVRRRRPGDRVGGWRGIRRAKVQDLMVNLGIPSEERDSIPIVCDAGGRILWVVGVWPRPTRTAPPAQGGGPRQFLLAERISAAPSAELFDSL